MINIFELQIGDWVTDENGFPMYVEGIFNDDTVYLNFEGNEGDVFEEDIADLKPIEITDELLKKLGFEQYFTVHEWRKKVSDSVQVFYNTFSHWGKDLVVVEKIQGSTKRKGSFTDVLYLHQLQNYVHMVLHAEIAPKTLSFAHEPGEE